MRGWIDRRLLAGAIACSLLGSAAKAQDVSVVAKPPATSAVPSDLGVDAFYGTRADALIWLKDDAGRAAAARLSGMLRTADIDGVAKASATADAVDAAIRGGTLADDKLISSALVAYVRALDAPVAEVGYGDPALQLKSPTAVAVLRDTVAAPALSSYLAETTAVNPLYRALRAAAFTAGATDNPQVAESLRRLRLVPAKGRAILVDINSAQLWMLEDGQAVDGMKVVVGKLTSPTPQLAGTIHYVTVNPYWHILDEVVQRKVAPVVIKRGVKYLKAARYETVSDWTKSEPVDPATIDWKAVEKGEQHVFVRQRPGANNMMGAVKFSFENDRDIFLHDTPHRELFAKAKRNFSLGCVRLEHADRLRDWLLKGEPVPASDEPESHRQLAEGVPVFLLNLPASVRDGQLVLADRPAVATPTAAAPDAVAH